jgi:hypothetical protein
MQLWRRGIFRDHGSHQLVKSTDNVANVEVIDSGVRLKATAVRGEGSSYRYSVTLSYAEIMECLYKIVGGSADIEKIEQAMRILKTGEDEYDPAIFVPDVVGLLARAAIKAQMPQETEEDAADSLFSEAKG